MSLPPGATLVSGTLPNAMRLPPGASLVDYEAEQAARPTVAPQPNPMPLVAPSGEALAGGGGPSPEALTGRREAFRTGTKAYGTTVGATMGAELLPEAYGAGVLGKLLLKPLTTGLGAAAGNVAGGGTPTEAAEAGATTAGGTALFGGLGLTARSLVRSGILGEGLANYFAEGPNGKFIPTNEARDIQRIHEAIGVKPGNMNIGLGASTPEDAWNLPGRAIKEAGFKPQDLEGLTPFEQAEKLTPFWQKAGQAVSDTAAAATKAGVKFDGAKSLTQAIGDMLDPEGTKALALANDTAEQLGIKDWRRMTPTQAVELKQALWQRLPARFRGPVYGALTRDLNQAVPGMVGVNRTYSEMRNAMEAIQDSAERYMSRASPTKFEQMLELLRKHPGITAPLGVGSSISAGMGAYQGGRALYDWMTGR